MASSTNQVYMDAVQKYNSSIKSNVQSLKQLQLEALDIITDRDCICALPTGYGKSLIYELLPFIDSGSFVIVIAPLNAIIEQQLKKLGSFATSLSPDKCDLNKLKNGEFSFLFCHPEQILHNNSVFELLSSEAYTSRNIYLVVDEAHCIVEWGEDFRKDYKQIYQLRAIVSCHVLALSATITQESANKIAKSLLMTSYGMVCGPPAKDNIVIIVQRRPSPAGKGNNAITPYDYVFEPLIQQLRSELDAFGITIVYCKSMQWLGHAYEMARRLLGPLFYKGDPKLENARVTMFHSSMEKESGQLKSMVLSSLQKPDEECQIRLVFASVALGMGAHLHNVKRIVHAGPPTTLETYVQEIGRAGRTGDIAEAILYFNNNDVSLPSVHKEMKKFCVDTAQCRREIIDNFFGFKAQVKPPICCNYCDSQIGLSWDFSGLKL